MDQSQRFTLRYLPILVLLVMTGLALYLSQFTSALTAPETEEIELRNLTWVEVRSMIEHGKSTVIIPTAGIEQNGPHAVLGKHGYVVEYTAGAIARALKDALVAPTIETVPEGSVDPPQGHMTFSGTISVPEEVFELILEHTARSLQRTDSRPSFFWVTAAAIRPDRARLPRSLTLNGMTLV